MMMTDGQDVLSACKDLAKALKGFNSHREQTIANNSAKGLDWGTPGVIDEEAEGVTQSEVSNVLGSLASFDTFWATHGGNFEKLTTAIV